MLTRLALWSSPARRAARVAPDGPVPAASTVRPVSTSSARDVERTPTLAPVIRAGRRPREVALAKAILQQARPDVGDAATLRALDEDAGLHEAVTLHAWASAGAVEQAALHWIVNTDTPLSEGRASLAERAGVLAALERYAQHWGLAGARLEDTKVIVTIAGQDHVAGTIDVRDFVALSADALLRKLGRVVNGWRVESERAVPPLVPVDASAREPSLANALASAHLSSAVYRCPREQEAMLGALGFDVGSYTCVENRKTATRALVTTDRQGNIHVVFRGSDNVRNWRANAAAALVAPLWLDDQEAKVHSGALNALQSIWLDLEAALARARAHVGNDAPVFMSGHSMGGALAQLAVTRAEASRLIERDQALVQTFGGSCPGNAAFARRAEQAAPRQFRFVHVERASGRQTVDPVPQLPFAALGYAHAGSQVDLSRDGLELAPPHVGSPLQARLAAATAGAASTTPVAADSGRDDDDGDDRATGNGGRVANMMSTAAEATALVTGYRAADGTRVTAGRSLHLVSGYLEDLGAALVQSLR